MKWWGVLLLVLFVCGVGGGAFFLGKHMTPSAADADKAADEADKKTEKDRKKEEEKKDKAEGKGDKKDGEKNIFPTLPRLKRYLKPVKTRDVFSQRYALIHNSPNWRAQTGYGPPADVHERLFSQDVLLGQEYRLNKRVLFTKREKSPYKRWQYQVEFGAFNSYKKAAQRLRDLQKRVHDPLIICDIVDRKGGVRYFVRLRAPMSAVEAQDYIAYCIEAADMVARVVPYAF